MRDFSFQGRIELAERLPNGMPGAFVWVGDQSSCELSFNTESEDRTETYSGQRLQSARLRTGTTVEGEIVLRYFNKDNLKLGLYATEQNVAGATVSDEILGGSAVLADGMRLALAKPWGVSALTIEDAEETPLVAGTHYELESAATGVIRLLSTTGLEGPLSASYTHLGFSNLPMFTQDPPERWLRLNGVNTLTGERVLLDLYRLQFNPFGSLPLINPGFGELPLSFTALYDVDKANDASLGGFGRIQLPAAA